MSNKALHKAKEAKYDEFYTQFNDIGNEVLSYDLDQFKDKVVLCPCDDPTESNFTLFFAKNFKRLGLRKLISTGYQKDGHGKKYELTGDANGDGVINQHDIVTTDLEGDGDFNSDEVKALRDEADIICTNPPFSLFRDFLAWINPDEKKFLILSNINAITYKEVFPLIRDNKMWLGVRKMGIDTYFKITEDYKKKLIEGNRPNAYKIINGEVMARVGCIWFTNMDYRGRHENLPLLPKDVLEASGVVYQKYDNYDAIEVPEIKLIPSDYAGVMGVPISFLGSYNPEQFEIIGIGIGELGQSIGIGANITTEQWAVIITQDKNLRKGTLLLCDNNGKYTAPYARVLIKNKYGTK